MLRLNERPIEAFILSLLGSLFVVMGATLGYLIFLESGGFVPLSRTAQALTGVAIFLGSTMFIVSLLLYLRPELHVAWGVVLLVVAVGSIVGGFSGFAGFGIGIIGTVLGILGGAFAIAWRPGTGLRGSTAAGAPYRVCQNCGRGTPFGYAYCPFCGAAAPVVGPPGRDVPPASPPR